MNVSPYLICYDIREPRRLQKVHKLVCHYAMPVQYSVFYAKMDKQTVEALINDLESLIDERVDDVRIYGVAGLEYAEMIGELPIDHFLMRNRRKNAR